MKTTPIKLTLVLLLSFLFNPPTYSQQQTSNEPATKVFFAVDTSGSMKSNINWLGHSLPAITNALTTQPQWLDAIKLYGFTNKAKLLHQGHMSDIVDTLQTVDFQGGSEDGLMSIEQIIREGNPRKGAHIILVTDENRQQAKSIDFDDLLNTLNSKQITVHVFLLHRAVNEPPVNGFKYIKDHDGIKVGVKMDLLTMPGNAADNKAVFDKLIAQRKISPQKKARHARLNRPLNKNNEYIALALQTGGYVWGLPEAFLTKANRENEQPVFAHVMAATIMNIKTSLPSATVTVAGDMLSGLNHAGELITFDASDTGSHSVETWQWDFDGDGTIDDVGPSVYTQFEQPGNYRVKLWLSDGAQKQLQIINVEVVQ